MKYHSSFSNLLTPVQQYTMTFSIFLVCNNTVKAVAAANFVHYNQDMTSQVTLLKWRYENFTINYLEIK